MIVVRHFAAGVILGASLWAVILLRRDGGAVMTLPDSVICRRQLCADHTTCAGELLALCERIANRPDRDERDERGRAA